VAGSTDPEETAVGLREDKKLSIEHRIYKAAMDLFVEQGYEKTTLIDIAAEADVSTRTLYRFFPTKEQLLRRFTRENLNSLKIYAGELPPNMDLKEQLLAIMIRDFTTMFCSFEIAHVLHTARQEGRMIAKFEIENVETCESIYYHVFKHEQLRHGSTPGENTRLAASVTVAIYRHASDMFRFHEVGRLDERKLRAYYASRLAIIWESLYASLMNAEA